MEPEQNTMGVAPRPSVIDLDNGDLTHMRLALISMMEALKKGPKSRERALVATKLEEAFMWAGAALGTDP